MMGASGGSMVRRYPRGTRARAPTTGAPSQQDAQLGSRYISNYPWSISNNEILVFWLGRRSKYYYNWSSKYCNFTYECEFLLATNWCHYTVSVRSLDNNALVKFNSLFEESFRAIIMYEHSASKWSPELPNRIHPLGSDVRNPSFSSWIANRNSRGKSNAYVQRTRP